jgi:hypothetical protein
MGFVKDACALAAVAVFIVGASAGLSGLAALSLASWVLP